MPGDVNLTILDGALGALPPSANGVHVKLGCCSGGAGGTIYAFSDPADVASQLGAGPLAEAVAYALTAPTQGVAARPVLCVRLPPTYAGAFGTARTDRVGSSTGTITAGGSPLDLYRVRVRCTLSGGLAAGRFRVSLDGGQTEGDEHVFPADGGGGSGDYAIPGTGITLTFAGSLDAGDAVRFTASAPTFSASDLAAAAALLYGSEQDFEGVHVVGGTRVTSMSAVTAAGTSPPTVSLSGTAVDWVQLVVQITSAGTRGTARFRYSLDGGRTWSDPIATAATYVLDDTGLTLAFASGTYALDNSYTANNGATGGGSDFVAVVDAAVTQSAAAETSKRYLWWGTEAPDAPDADLEGALSTRTSARVTVGAGRVELVSAIDGRVARRSALWPVLARAVATSSSVDPGEFALGPLANLSRLVRDERRTPLLEAARYTTLRTYQGARGAYVTSARMLAGAGSDFAELPNRRVMDVACTVARLAGLRYLRSRLRVIPAGQTGAGRILELDARRVENFVQKQLVDALRAGADGGDASAVAVEVIRTDNLLSTGVLRLRIRVTPVGYARSISETISFDNPALAAA